MKPNWKNRTLFTEDNRLDETLSTKIDRVNDRWICTSKATHRECSN